MKKIYCIGGATIDRKLKVLESIQSSTSNPVTSMTTFGGVARNIAENLAQWTSGVHLQSVLGDDNDGRALFEYLHKSGINTQACTVLPNHQTAHYYAVLDKTGELHNAFADMEIFNHVTINLLNHHWQKWETNNIMFLDTNFPTPIVADIIQTHAMSQLLIIDPVSIAKAKKLPADLTHTFLLKPNQQEAEVLSGMSIANLADCKKAGLKILARGAKNVVISLGKDGYMLVNADMQQHFTTTARTEIHDVNGAGDAFIAGIILGLQQENDLVEACKLGAAAATLTLQSQHSVVRDMTALTLLQQLKQGQTHAAVF